MTYALSTLWHDRQRFFSAVLAVTFSCVLICLQFGILIGTFALTSIPIDHSRADLWLHGAGAVSVDVGRIIPEGWRSRIASHPDIAAAESMVLGFEYWSKPDGGNELCIIVGSQLADESMGSINQLTPELRSKLTEPGAIIVDRRELRRLGLNGIGDTAEMRGKRVRIVGLVNGLGSLQGPYLFCSLETGRRLLSMKPDQITYVLGRVKPGIAPETVARKLRGYPRMEVHTSQEFSMRSRMHWLTKTGAGIALGLAAVLGLLVGAVVTRQALHAATIASLREYAVLRALGIPRWRMALHTVYIAFWIGLAGVALALPTILALLQAARTVNVPVDLPLWLMASAIALTWLVAIVSALTTLRVIHQIEPAMLLR